MAHGFSIGNIGVGDDHRAFIIAELSANHAQSLDKAIAIVDAAAAAGADAVKLQTYTADTITLDCDAPVFHIRSGTLWDGTTLHRLYSAAYMPWEWHQPLMERAAAHGLVCFSSPFDSTAVDFLQKLDVPAWKIASFELVDVGLIREVAATKKPVIMSTGMASLEEIEEAVSAARDAGAHDLALLVCSSAYPSPPELLHLKRLEDLRRRFDVVVGLSDHTSGIVVPVAATALGSKIVEKHLTLSRADGGPDAAFSLEPSEFAEMVKAVRTAERALGGVQYGQDGESSSRVFRRSLFAVQYIPAGGLLTRDNVRSIRPAAGLHPRHLGEVVGRKARSAIARGTPLAWELFE
jgi:pseudaminic acid synthase